MKSHSLLTLAAMTMLATAEAPGRIAASADRDESVRAFAPAPSYSPRRRDTKANNTTKNRAKAKAASKARREQRKRK